MNLDNNPIFKQQCYVNGEWLNALGLNEIEVINPATHQPIGNVPNMGEVEVKHAVESAHEGFLNWRALSAKQRGEKLQSWYQLAMDNKQDLAHLLTLEQGKPLSEALGEIDYGASYIQWFAEEAKRVYGDMIPAHSNDRKILVSKEPVGVVAAITPWNFPNAMITRKAAAALAAGCSVIVKPASSTPFSALAMAELAHQAGIPAGVFNVVTGSARVIGKVLTEHPLVRKVSFTGSTETGRTLLSQCASTIKKVSMELGGNAPFIVFDDAELDKAVAGVLASKFRNTGQTCVCANRIFVHDRVYDAFAQRLAKAVQQLNVGNGLLPDINLGPLIDINAVKKVQEHISDAVSKGAQVFWGGKRHDLRGNFFQPTILTDVSTDALIMREETFGPVAPLIRFFNDEDVVNMANDTEFGLASYFYSKDVNRIWRVADQLEYGIVGVNEGIISSELAPFGGIKQSGIGREGSKYGLDDYLEIKYICMGGL